MFNSWYIRFGLLDPYLLLLKAHVPDLWKWDTIDPGVFVVFADIMLGLN